MNKFRSISLIILTLFASLLLCVSTYAVTADKAPKQLTIVLDWLPNPNHAPLLLAEQKGFFKKRGLDVRLLTPTDPSDPIKLVTAGKADIGLIDEAQLIYQTSHGLPIAPIGTFIDRPLNCIMVLQKNKIYSLADLKGKTIAYSSSSTGLLVLKTILAHNGLTPNDVTLINVHYNLVQALLAGRVDAVTGVMRNVEPIELEQKNIKTKLFYPEDNGVPLYDELVFIARSDRVNDSNLTLFLQALKESVAELTKHPNSSFKIVADEYKEFQSETNKNIWFKTIPYFAKHPERVNHARIKKFTRFLQQAN